MNDFVIMVDVNADIDPGYAEKEGIEIFPQYYHFNDGVIYGDEQKLTSEQFYGRLEAGEQAFSMGCNPDRVHGIMEKAVQAGHDIIALMASSKCSGSFNTVHTEAEEIMAAYPGSRIYVCDTYLETSPIALLAYMAQDMKKEGAGFDDVVRMLEERKGDCDVLFIVNDLKYLVRGGRLNPLSGSIGTLLKIKPVLHCYDGLLAPMVKCRGFKAARQTLIDTLKAKDLEKQYFCVLYTGEKGPSEKFAELLEQELGLKALSVQEVNPTIGTHIGPGGIGVALCEKHK